MTPRDRCAGRRWLQAWLCRALLACLLAGAACRAPAEPIQFTRMQRLASPATVPPGDEPGGGASGWTEVALPDEVERGNDASAGMLWYRGEFPGPAELTPRLQWAVCLPFLYEGGQIWVNGALAGSVPESTPALRVRWERPHLITLPAGLLQPGINRIAIRTGAVPPRAIHHFPRVLVGPEADLRPRADRRTFWVRSLPQVTVVVCLLVATLMLFIYWRRRSETLYGLFGLAAALWGVRTLTFVIERMPAGSWHLWRITYLAATGGFIAMLALFAMRIGGIRRPLLEKGLVAYWLAGPLWLLCAGAAGDALVDRVWTAGLIPIGIAILGISGRTMWRQRTFAAAVMPATLAVAVLTGMHDYLVAWNTEALARFMPGWWVGQRIFLLHYGANLVLLGMSGLLAVRFIDALAEQEAANARLAELNETLESRVAEREHYLARNFERMADLQRAHAAAQERELIMREIHDGLGSRLFTSLMRVERQDMDRGQIAEVLRDCIADMRLALELLAPDDDFQSALGNFLFRWQAQMLDAQVTPGWTIDLPEGGPRPSRQAALQLLRVAQEALTNVLKHSGARHVQIGLHQRDGQIELQVSDDGQGNAALAHRGGRGIGNMRARARQLGGDLQLESGPAGTRVLLRMPLATGGPAQAVASAPADATERRRIP